MQSLGVMKEAGVKKSCGTRGYLPLVRRGCRIRDRRSAPTPYQRQELISCTRCPACIVKRGASGQSLYAAMGNL